MAVISEGRHDGLEYTGWLSTQVGLRKIENFLQKKRQKAKEEMILFGNIKEAVKLDC